MFKFCCIGTKCCPNWLFAFESVYRQVKLVVTCFLWQVKALHGALKLGLWFVTVVVFTDCNVKGTMVLREANKTFDSSCALCYSLGTGKWAKLEVVGAKGMLSNVHMVVLIVVDDCYGKALNITRLPNKKCGISLSFQLSRCRPSRNEHPYARITKTLCCIETQSPPN